MMISEKRIAVEMAKLLPEACSALQFLDCQQETTFYLDQSLD